MSASYLVYDDKTGEFVSIDDIQSVTEKGSGSLIELKSREKSITSPLKPREILRRLSIIRYKKEHPDAPVSKSDADVSNEPKTTSGVAPSRDVPKKK